MPIMALTATATGLVQTDIKKQLGIENCEEFKGSFNRTNLFYEVRKKQTFDKTGKEIVDFIKSKYPQNTGIIYCLSKKDCNKLKDFLQAEGLSVGVYHSGIAPDEKKEMHSKWSKDELQIMVATVV